MAGSTLRIDIDRTARPGRRGLPTVTTGVGAGAAVEAWRAATLIVKVGRNADLGAAAVMGSAIVAGVTARGHRTEAQQIMRGVGTGGIR